MKYKYRYKVTTDNLMYGRALVLAKGLDLKQARNFYKRYNGEYGCITFIKYREYIEE